MSTVEHFQDRLENIIKTLDANSVSRDDIVELLLAVSFSKRYDVVPEATHLKLVELFCRSSGLIQELIHKFRILPLNDTLESLVLHSNYISLSALDFTSIITDLCITGYARLPCRLDPGICKNILEYAYLQEYSCLAQHDDQHTKYAIQGLDEIRPYTLSAGMKESSIHGCELIDIIINDPVILGLATFYLRSSVCIRSVSLWHSFESAFHRPSGELAQLFHYDLDEFRWLKLFIFLTDVTPENGPHVFIPGSHRPGFKHPHLLSRGYSRISDEDMDHFHPRSSWEYVTCPAGTLVLADTRCWHKGTPIKSGVRTVLQPEYAPTRFSRNLI